MSITQTAMALGNWNLKLKPNTPRAVLDQLSYFGHIAVSTGRPDPRVSGDTLLTSARYVGVLRGQTQQGEGWALSGSGMAFWIGDENDKGPVLTSQLLFTSSTFTNAITQCLAAGNAVVAGNLYSVTGAYTGVHQWQTTRKAITYICATMTADSLDPVEWRVNNNATLDAGHVSDLYVTNPVAAIVRRHVGSDMTVRALAGKAVTTADVTDFTTQAVLLAQGQGAQIASGSATIAPGLNPYKDLRGNPVKIVRAASESVTDPNNAPARAAILLAQYQSPRKAVNLSTAQFDITGDVQVGDWVWVHDPDAGLVDTSASPNEVVFRGERINPTKLRVKEMTWPVVSGMSVAYRDPNGAWIDLTDYVVFESGDTHVVVGGYDRSLINPSGIGESLGSRPMPNTSVPGVPTFTTPFPQSVYQSANSGITKAQVQVRWTQPANVDGSAIIDGDHYEVRYRSGSTPIFPATHSQMAGYTHDQLHAGTQAQPITYPTGPWQTVYAPWDSTQVLIQELTPGVPYDIQVRAVDNGKPPNNSAWSATTTIQTVGDTLAPSTPAPPTVAGSRIAVQLVHNLGRADGGTFNLEADLHHLEVHAQYEPLFTPTDSTLLGKLIANNGMILAGIPAVGTFQVESVAPVYVKVIAVDEAGNKSAPSVSASATAQLIDDAHISNLTVSKILAGTINADWIVGARIKTANSGARVEMSPDGIQAYNAANTQTVDISASTGDATITGKLQTGTTGQRVIVDPNSNGFARILMYDDTTTNYVTQDVFGGNFQIQARRVSDSTPNGGRLLFNLASDGSGSAYLAFQNASSSWHYQVGSNGGHHLKGFFAKVDSQGGLGALHVDQVGGSGTSMSYSYGATYATTPLPFVEIQGTSGSPPTASSHAVTARSQTGFSIQYPAGNCDVFVWAVRYG